MKDFQALIRDTLASKNPAGTWQKSKNIVLKGSSIRNEDGLKFQYLVNGTIVGIIASNSHIVYFHKNETGTDEIGVVNTNNDTPTYTTVIKDNQLNFNLNCPIEGVFIYNFKGDLIISWCDGVKSNSNPPRVLNTTDLPFDVNPDGTLVTPAEFYLINLNPNLHQGNLAVDYLDFGTLGGYAAYITFSYVYNDDSLAGYFPSSYMGYLGIGVNPTLQRGLRLTFSDLDTNFSRLRIGLVIRTEAEGEVASALIGYESDIFNFTGTDYQIDIGSLNNFTESSAETILIEQAYFTKVNTMTKYDNQSIIANVETSNEFNFQKYANLINVVPVEYIEEADDYYDNIKGQNPSFMPDEVYSLYIELHLLNGRYTDRYHIPGRAAEGTETDVLTAGQKTQYDLAWTDTETGIKQFHIINNGYAASMANFTSLALNPVPVDESSNKMGYWENVETYPNDDEYDSTLDYDNNALGGTDLRGTPIRYHRMPTVESMYNNTLGSDGLPMPLLHTNLWGMPSRRNNETRHRKLGIKLTNIADIIPAEILAQIQGYRISHVVRNSNNGYVAGNWVGVRRHDFDDIADAGGDGLGDTDSEFEYYNFGFTNAGVDDPQFRFDKLRVLGNELFKFRPSLQPLYVRVNYSFPLNEYDDVATFGVDFSLSPEGFVVPDDQRFSKCNTGLIYRPGNSIVNETEHHEEGVNLDLKDDLLGINLVDTFPGGTPVGTINDNPYMTRVVLNITAYSHKLNVYTGFTNDDANIVGRTATIANDTVFKGGDNFVENEININVRGLHRVWDYFGGGGGLVRRWHVSLPILVRGLNSPVNASELYNDEPVDRTETDTAVLDLYDYDFDVLGQAGLSSIQNLLATFAFDVDSDFVNRFPFRIYRGLKLPNEGLTTEALSTYLIDDYYEMPNDKGEIIAVRGKERALFIQHRFSLFVAAVKDKLKTQNVDAYLGTSDLFERTPEELLSDDKGYIGSVSKFACMIVKGMYITINQVNGQIFIIKEDVKEITDKGNKEWFWENLDNGLTYFDTDYTGEQRRIDNPFISVGHLVGYDKEYSRLIFTKKFYRFIGSETDHTFDGEFHRRSGVLLEFTDTNEFEDLSRTFSFNLESNRWSWISEHDYFPNLIFYTSNGLFSITNKLTGTDRASVYKHNDKLTKGLFYGNKFDSYVDLIFNQNLEISKLLKNVTWITDVINNNGGYETFKTITHIMIYNNNQCSGIINLKDNQFDLTRNIEGDWNFNDFRDLVINPSNPIIDDNGDLIQSNINLLTLWFEKSNFISKFITVRLIIDNVDNDTVSIHQVNVNSIISRK